jgi:hypothetical protein
MAKDEHIPVYGCPFCDATVRGPPNNPKLGAANLQTHVKSKHTDKYDEFMKTPIENYEIEEEPPKPEEQPQSQVQQQQFQVLPKAPLPKKIEIPFHEVLKPEDWIADFLKKYEGIKDKFIIFQQQLAAETGNIPDPRDLEDDLNGMDSGLKNKKEAELIRYFYENALEKYISQLDEQERRGIPMREEQPMRRNISRGIPIRQPREYESSYPQETFPPNLRGRAPTSWMEDELMRLREDAKRRDEDDRRRKDQETAELKAQLVQLQQQLASGGGGNPRLEQKLEQMEADRRRMEEQYAQLKENTLLTRIQQIEALARSGPSSEDIKSWLKDTVDQYRNQILVEKNLEEMIEKKLAQHGGPTQTAVEMEKARNEFALGVKKLEIEEKKASQWGDTLKNVAGVFGEEIGKGMAGKTQGQQQPPAGATACPHCGVPLILPPNVRYGMCPSCNGKIEVDANGIPQKFIEPATPLPPSTEIAPPPPTEEVMPPTPAPPTVETAQKRYKHRKIPETDAP